MAYVCIHCHLFHVLKAMLLLHRLIILYTYVPKYHEYAHQLFCQNPKYCVWQIFFNIMLVTFEIFQLGSSIFTHMHLYISHVPVEF